MKVVIQKTGPAKIEIAGNTHSEIEKGLLVLLGITNGDNDNDIEYLVEKIANLRVFESDGKHFEKSILETGKEILIVSQFTLYASCNSGRRPDFIEAAKPKVSEPLYDKFVSRMKEKGLRIKTGVFGADMQVHLVNDGPITIIIDSKTK